MSLYEKRGEEGEEDGRSLFFEVTFNGRIKTPITLERDEIQSFDERDLDESERKRNGGRERERSSMIRDN